MDLQLNGHRAIVTGSSADIGEAIARKLAARSPTTGITVNTVSPGIIVTPGVREFYQIEARRRGWDEDWSAS